MKKILKSLFVVVAVSGLAVAATSSFFSDTETSAGNVLQAGAIDLRIDNESYYNGVFNQGTSWNLADLDGDEYLFFNFADLKPGDWGEDTISLHVNSNDAYACMDISLTANDDNDSNEPELDVEGEVEDNLQNLWDGELAQNLQFIWWADDGDNVLEDDEYESGRFYLGPLYDMGFDQSFKKTFSLVDSVNDLWGDGALLASETYYIGKAWCFGELTPAPLEQDGSNEARNPSDETGGGITCSAEGDHNIAQTDLVRANVSFYAVQTRHNDNFTCQVCEETGPGWAQKVLASDQALRNDGSAVLPERSNPSDVLGVPDGQFFSLGFGGSLDVAFASKVYDVAGDEVSFVSVHEVTNNPDSYPEETADVYVSQDGVAWEYIGEATNKNPGGVSNLDIAASGYDWIQYVRLVDTSNPEIHNSEADGFDVDAIDASHLCLDKPARPEED